MGGAKVCVDKPCLSLRDLTSTVDDGKPLVWQ
jgi:hypothetical protein